MSVKVFCDRCGREATETFRLVKIEALRGAKGGFVTARLLDPFDFRGDLCDYCVYQLRLLVLRPDLEAKPTKDKA